MAILAISSKKASTENVIFTNQSASKPNRVIAQPSPFRRLAAQNILSKTKNTCSSTPNMNNTQPQACMMTPMTKKVNLLLF